MYAGPSVCLKMNLQDEDLLGLATALPVLSCPQVELARYENLWHKWQPLRTHASGNTLHHVFARI